MKNGNRVIKSILLAVLGAILLSFSVLFAHNQLVTNNQLKNNHEKLDLIASKIEKSKAILAIW